MVTTLNVGPEMMKPMCLLSAIPLLPHESLVGGGTDKMNGLTRAFMMPIESIFISICLVSYAAFCISDAIWQKVMLYITAVAIITF